MSKQIQTEIFIEGEQLKYFSSIQINQQFNSHHTFQLIVNHDAFEDLGNHNLQNSQQNIGKRITILFGDNSNNDNSFKGIITEVGMQHSNGLWGNIILKGFSPTFLMDSGRHMDSYYKKTLSTIVKKLTGNLGVHDMKININPMYANEIPYICQYNESHYNFINRISSEYGEWFYYTGEELFFGRPSSFPQIDLLYGEHIEDMSFSMRILPTKVKHYGYDSITDEVNTVPSPTENDASNDYTKHALEVSDDLFKSHVLQATQIRTYDKNQLDEYAKRQKGIQAASTILLVARGDNPKVKLGCHVNIKMAQKEISSQETPTHGKYLVTNITHNFTSTGDYTNTFEAIPSDTDYIPFTVEHPIAETQTAIVKENADPKHSGRVRVQMHWQKDKGEMTDWIRVLTPDAGSSDKVSKNRGFVFVPEIGDQVLIGFRYNDPNRPFVMGSMFHGKIGSGGSDDNHSKTIITRSGNKMVMNDKTGSILLSDPSGNTVTMHGNGTITIHAPKVLNLVAPDINLTAANSINLTSKPDKDGGEGTISITSEKELTASSETKSIFLISKKEDVALMAETKNIAFQAKEDITMEGKNISSKSDEKMVLAGGKKLEASSSDSTFD